MCWEIDYVTLPIVDVAAYPVHALLTKFDTENRLKYGLRLLMHNLGAFGRIQDPCACLVSISRGVTRGFLTFVWFGLRLSFLNYLNLSETGVSSVCYDNQITFLCSILTCYATPYDASTEINFDNITSFLHLDRHIFSS